MDVISEIFDMIGDILELVITQVVKRKEAKENILWTGKKM